MCDEIYLFGFWKYLRKFIRDDVLFADFWVFCWDLLTRVAFCLG